MFWQHANFGEDMISKIYLRPDHLGCAWCAIKGSDSDVFSLLFVVPPIICGGYVFGLGFVIQFFVPFLVLQSFH